MSRPRPPGRRVRCDRALPSCLRCSKAGRACGGYAAPVFWPKKGDTRRSSVGPRPPPGGRAHRAGDGVQFLHVSWWDIAAHDYMAQQDWSRDPSSSCVGADVARKLPKTLSWIPDMSASDKQLVQYFDERGSWSLRCLGQDATAIRATIASMAFSENTTAASSLVHALLALSSFLQGDPTAQALQHKASAIRALQASMQKGLGRKEVLQHIAANMLLCSLDVYLARFTGANWAWHVAAAVQLVNSAPRFSLTFKDGDCLALLAWVHYHNVLAQFSYSHWRRGERPMLADMDKPLQLPYASGPEYELLCLLADVFHATKGESEPDEARATMLERKLLAMDMKQGETSHGQTMLELYRLAGLVYLSRCRGRGANAEEWAAQALPLLTGAEASPWPFAVLVLGFEARTDEQRLGVLEAMARTERRGPWGNLGCARDSLRMAWVHDDLAPWLLGYRRRLTAMLSAFSNCFPTYL
ncbi:fungal-specific transcription factor domain-containing protein [Stachybotrys elegans]|uniref:Fungal-specific transcription factor domain-containing protein n=1 Tax=Stachybotrys elegans TaxID=80388 RepID=A0A8K0SPE1_9HYPO|nr:fungal-specific transcription factor domain-containing protein [Stachybotrys elegans]